MRLPARLVRQTIASLAALAAVFGTGCRKDAGTARPTTKTIGVTLLSREQVFYRDLEQGLRQAADAHGYKLVITAGDFDLAKQQSQIDDFLVQKVDAIIVCPVDTRGIAPAIEKAAAAHVPVFTADIAAAGAPVVSHVASDNVEGGRLAARFIAQTIGHGDVGIIGQPELQSTIDRERGFRDEMAKHPGITIVASLNGGGVRDRALKAADDMLQAHPTISAIFGINDDTALGALSSAQSHHRDNLVIVGYDLTPEARQAIASGSALRADVAQEPREIGVKTIEAIAAHFAGQRTPPVVTVPVRLISAESLRASDAAAGGARQ
jgi:ribose transport system substrate-binding protein